RTRARETKKPRRLTWPRGFRGPPETITLRDRCLCLWLGHLLRDLLLEFPHRLVRPRRALFLPRFHALAQFFQVSEEFRIIKLFPEVPAGRLRLLQNPPLLA